MAQLITILICWFLFGAIVNFFEAGEYAHGYEVHRKGNLYVIIDLIFGIVDLILIYGLISGW